MKNTAILLVLLCLSTVTGCGNSTVQAAGASALAGTITIPAGTAIAAGSCATLGLALPGANTSMAVVVTPAGDPQPAGFVFPMLFAGFVDGPDHVTIKVCKVASPSITTTSDLIANVKLF